MQKRPILKKMQVLPRPLLPVMNPLIHSPANRTGQSLALTNQVKVNLPLIRLKPNVRHLPRRLQTQRYRKQIRRHDALNPSMTIQDKIISDFHTKGRSAHIFEVNGSKG
jgi:hypothetical protein